MQKQILFMCMLLTTTIIAMEEFSKVPLQLTHQSPEITCVHTQKYLEWLERTHDSEQLKADLKLVKTVLNATDDVIKAKKNDPLKPHYSICVIPDNYYGAGNSEHNYADSYGIIPIAAAHALKSNKFKRVLILNLLESATKSIPCESDEYHNEIKEYYIKGNGSLLYPNKKNNPELFELFDGKIITSDKIENEILHFLDNAGKDIDLVFYNLDMEEQTDPLQVSLESKVDFCISQGLFNALLDKPIATVFILSGLKENKYDHTLTKNVLHFISSHTHFNINNFISYYKEGATPKPMVNAHFWYKTEI